MSKIKTEELRRVAAAVKPGLAKKEYLEQSTHLVFTGVDVCTFNSNTSVIHPFITEGAFSVKADDFYKLLGGITDDEVEISIEEGRVTLTSPTTKAGMSTVVDDAGKIEPYIDKVKEDIPAEWNPLPPDFLEGLKFVVFSAAKNLSLDPFPNVHINEERLETADGRMRASIYTMDDAMPEILFLATDASELINFPVTEYAFTSNWLHFKTPEDVIFSCLQRVPQNEKGKWPDIERHFEAIIDPITLQLPEALKQAVQAIIFLATGETELDKTCTVDLTPGEITVTGKREIGYVIKKVPFPAYKGSPEQFLINPVALTQILEKTTNITISPKTTRILFQNDKFRHLLSMLVKR